MRWKVGSGCIVVIVVGGAIVILVMRMRRRAKRRDGLGHAGVLRCVRIHEPVVVVVVVEHDEKGLLW
jgi:heme/copper-type cytochrome/quinol oxidase subunit 2